MQIASYPPRQTSYGRLCVEWKRQEHLTICSRYQVPDIGFRCELRVDAENSMILLTPGQTGAWVGEQHKGLPHERRVSFGWQGFPQARRLGEFGMTQVELWDCTDRGIEILLPDHLNVVKRQHGRRVGLTRQSVRDTSHRPSHAELRGPGTMVLAQAAQRLAPEVPVSVQLALETLNTELPRLGLKLVRSEGRYRVARVLP